MVSKCDRTVIKRKRDKDQMKSLNLFNDAFVFLCAGEVVRVVEQDENNGDSSEIDGMEYRDFRKILALREGIQELNINNVPMLIDVKCVSCYDDDPDCCPCCSWEYWTFKKVG